MLDNTIFGCMLYSLDNNCNDFFPAFKPANYIKNQNQVFPMARYGKPFTKIDNYLFEDLNVEQRGFILTIMKYCYVLKESIPGLVEYRNPCTKSINNLATDCDISRRRACKLRKELVQLNKIRLVHRKGKTTEIHIINKIIPKNSKSTEDKCVKNEKEIPRKDGIPFSEGWHKLIKKSKL